MDTVHLTNIQELDCEELSKVNGGTASLSSYIFEFDIGLQGVDNTPEIPEMPSWPGTLD